jgi:hypothetical protein
LESDGQYAQLLKEYWFGNEHIYNPYISSGNNIRPTFVNDYKSWMDNRNAYSQANPDLGLGIIKNAYTYMDSYGGGVASNLAGAASTELGFGNMMSMNNDLFDKAYGVRTLNPGVRQIGEPIPGIAANWGVGNTNMSQSTRARSGDSQIMNANSKTIVDDKGTTLGQLYPNLFGADGRLTAPAAARLESQLERNRFNDMSSEVYNQWITRPSGLVGYNAVTGKPASTLEGANPPAASYENSVEWLLGQSNILKNPMGNQGSTAAQTLFQGLNPGITLEKVGEATGNSYPFKSSMEVAAKIVGDPNSSAADKKDAMSYIGTYLPEWKNFEIENHFNYVGKDGLQNVKLSIPRDNPEMVFMEKILQNISPTNTKSTNIGWATVAMSQVPAAFQAYGKANFSDFVNSDGTINPVKASVFARSCNEIADSGDRMKAYGAAAALQVAATYGFKFEKSGSSWTATPPKDIVERIGAGVPNSQVTYQNMTMPQSNLTSIQGITTRPVSSVDYTDNNRLMLSNFLSNTPPSPLAGSYAGAIIPDEGQENKSPVTVSTPPIISTPPVLTATTPATTPTTIATVQKSKDYTIMGVDSDGNTKVKANSGREFTVNKTTGYVTESGGVCKTGACPLNTDIDIIRQGVLVERVTAPTTTPAMTTVAPKTSTQILSLTKLTDTPAAVLTVSDLTKQIKDAPTAVIQFGFEGCNACNVQRENASSLLSTGKYGNYYYIDVMSTEGKQFMADNPDIASKLSDIGYPQTVTTHNGTPFGLTKEGWINEGAIKFIFESNSSPVTIPSPKAGLGVGLGTLDVAQWIGNAWNDASSTVQGWFTPSTSPSAPSPVQTPTPASPPISSSALPGASKIETIMGNVTPSQFANNIESTAQGAFSSSPTPAPTSYGSENVPLGMGSVGYTKAQSDYYLGLNDADFNKALNSSNLTTSARSNLVNARRSKGSYYLDQELPFNDNAFGNSLMDAYAKQDLGITTDDPRVAIDDTYRAAQEEKGLLQSSGVLTTEDVGFMDEVSQKWVNVGKREVYNPNPTLAKTIDSNAAQLRLDISSFDSKGKDIDARSKALVDAAKTIDLKDAAAVKVYNAKIAAMAKEIEQYNQEANTLNNRVNKVSKDVEEYNRYLRPVSGLGAASTEPVDLLSLNPATSKYYNLMNQLPANQREAMLSSDTITARQAVAPYVAAGAILGITAPVMPAWLLTGVNAGFFGLSAYETGEGLIKGNAAETGLGIAGMALTAVPVVRGAKGAVKGAQEVKSLFTGKGNFLGLKAMDNLAPRAYETYSQGLGKIASLPEVQLRPGYVSDVGTTTVPILSRNSISVMRFPGSDVNTVTPNSLFLRQEMLRGANYSFEYNPYMTKTVPTNESTIDAKVQYYANGAQKPVTPIKLNTKEVAMTFSEQLERNKLGLIKTPYGTAAYVNDPAIPQFNYLNEGPFKIPNLLGFGHTDKTKLGLDRVLDFQNKIPLQYGWKFGDKTNKAYETPWEQKNRYLNNILSTSSYMKPFKVQPLDVAGAVDVVEAPVYTDTLSSLDSRLAQRMIENSGYSRASIRGNSGENYGPFVENNFTGVGKNTMISYSPKIKTATVSYPKITPAIYVGGSYGTGTDTKKRTKLNEFPNVGDAYAPSEFPGYGTKSATEVKSQFANLYQEQPQTLTKTQVLPKTEMFPNIKPATFSPAWLTPVPPPPPIKGRTPVEEITPPPPIVPLGGLGGGGSSPIWDRNYPTPLEDIFSTGPGLGMVSPEFSLFGISTPLITYGQTKKDKKSNKKVKGYTYSGATVGKGVFLKEGETRKVGVAPISTRKGGKI